ncbi:MAG: hypothetical protein K6E91_04265 [Butyrivibrio sp.]|nr:hypothetical protein [Butyrivibrio sp.]
MKIKLSSAIKTGLFLATTSVCLLAASAVLRSKESDYKYADFFTNADKIDVLFIGSSHVINAINPVELFDNFGITSYNMGGHGSVMQATYWELQQALEFCRPKCVVVDTYMLQKDYQYLDTMDEDYSDSDRETSVAQLHLNMDCWPLTDVKSAAIKDLIEDPDIQKQFFADFYVYHNRWEELNSEDYKVLLGQSDRNPLYGAEMRYEMELAPNLGVDIPDEEVLEDESVGTMYLRRIIESCQANGIDVLVTYLPCSTDDSDKRADNTAHMIANEYGVPFVNMLKEDVIDFYTDLNDTGHLNAIGALKASDYLGDVIAKRGIVPDHRGDPAYADWQARAYLYNSALNSLAVESENIYKQLHFLSLGGVSSIVYINDGSEAFGDTFFKKLIGNIAGSDAIISNTDGPYILINDAGTKKVYEASAEKELAGIKTSIGTLNYLPVDHLIRLLYADEDPDTNYLYDDEKLNYDIQVIAYDNETGEILSHSYYKSYGCNYSQ